MPLTPAQIDTIETWRLGFVATTLADGTPNLSPKGTFVVLNARTIAFAEMRSPGTLQALAHQPIAEVNFVDVLTRRGLRIKGATQTHPKGSTAFTAHLPAFTPHWPELIPAFNAIITLSTDSIRPLSTPAYDHGATEADLRAHWAAKIAEIAL